MWSVVDTNILLVGMIITSLVELDEKLSKWLNFDIAQFTAFEATPGASIVATAFSCEKTRMTELSGNERISTIDVQPF